MRIVGKTVEFDHVNETYPFTNYQVLWPHKSTVLPYLVSI
jgi:hypothetical protein